MNRKSGFRGRLLGWFCIWDVQNDDLLHISICSVSNLSVLHHRPQFQCRSSYNLEFSPSSSSTVYKSWQPLPQDSLFPAGLASSSYAPDSALADHCARLQIRPIFTYNLLT